MKNPHCLFGPCLSKYDGVDVFSSSGAGNCVVAEDGRWAMGGKRTSLCMSVCCLFVCLFVLLAVVCSVMNTWRVESEERDEDRQKRALSRAITSILVKSTHTRLHFRGYLRVSDAKYRD
jgi:heme/copper-type cytochrome/quinol oxidase subunit 3